MELLAGSNRRSKYASITGGTDTNQSSRITMQTGTGTDAAVCFVSPSVSPYHAAAEPTLFSNTGKHDSQTVNIFCFAE